MKTSLVKFLTAATAALTLAACGGGGGGVATGGTGGTGAVARIASGEITNFGSIFVGGVEFDCTNAQILDDDGTIDQGPGDRCAEGDLLAQGMIVRVDGTRSDDNNGRATRVHVNPVLRGPVTSVNITNGTFTVLQQTVVVEDTTRFKIGTTDTRGTSTGLTQGLPLLQGLPANTPVQVFGFVGADNTIVATFVRTRIKRDRPENEFEIKGIVSVSGSAVTVGNLAIAVGSFTSPALVNGMCVELKGSITSGTLTLTRAPETDDDCNGGSTSSSGGAKAEVEGIVSDLAGTTPNFTFKVGSQQVKTTDATSFRQRDGGPAGLANGIKVEAEGPITEGVMTAVKVDLKKSRSSSSDD